MVLVADAAVAIRGDLSKFGGDLKGAGKQVDTLGQKFSAALTPKNLLLGAGGAFAGLQVAQFLGDAIGAASDLGETVSKTSQILGEEALPGLEDWAEGAASAFGQSKRQALDGAATFATFGKSANLAGDELVDFSTDMVELAGDLASFHNTSPEEAIEAIGAALRGEAEPIRKYGVLLDDATLRQRAMKLGIIQTTTQALKPQEKVLAAQAEILAQTSDAQGDFARTSDGLANQQRILSAELENVTAEIGEKLLPVAVELATFAVDVLVPALTSVVDYFDTAGENIGEFSDGVSDYITTAQIRFGDLGKTIEDRANEVGVDVVGMKELVRKAMTKMGMDIGDAMTFAEQRLAGLPVASTDAGRRMLAEWKQMDLGGQATGIFEPVGDAIEAEVDEGVDAAVERVRQSPGEMASALEEGRSAWADSWARMMNAGKEELLKSNRITRNLARLHSSELTEALASDDPARKLWALQTRRDLIASLNIDGYNYGRHLVQSFQLGLRDHAQSLVDESGFIAARVRGTWAIESEPKDPNSPFRGVTTWGGNFIKTIAQGMHDEMGSLATMASLLPVIPSATAGIAGPVSMHGAAGGVTKIYQIYTDGVRKDYGSAREMVSDLERIGETWG